MKDYFNNEKKCSTFFDFSFDYSVYDSLRNHFIGLFIKFFVTCLNPLQFNLNENKIEIDLITPIKIKNDEKANELLNTLYTTAQSDLIYKYEIIKKGEFDIKKIQKIILLDYFLKISSNDKNRAYFEPQKTSEKLNKIKIEEQISIIQNLFKYKDILNDNRNIFYYLNRIHLYYLQNKKSDYEINEARYFIPHIEFYGELAKLDKSRDIEDIRKVKALDYMIFFGENFELHFGQFVNKKNNYLLDNKNDDEKIFLSNIDNIENKKMYEKYFKITLDEAEIFYD